MINPQKTIFIMKLAKFNGTLEVLNLNENLPLPLLNAGDFARIVIQHYIYRESFWVQILSREGNSYTARVDNRIGDLWNIELDSVIKIQHKNILSGIQTFGSPIKLKR